MQTDQTKSLPPLPWTKATAPVVIKALVQSGLSVHKFSVLHQVPAHRVFYWRKKLKGARPNTSQLGPESTLRVPYRGFQVVAHFNFYLSGVAPFAGKRPANSIFSLGL